MKKKVKWIVLSGILAIVLVTVLVFWRNPHFIYIIGEYFGVNCEEIEMIMLSPDNLQEYAIGELNADDRVIFNQSAMLINADYPLPNDFVPSLTQYKDTDVSINECVEEAYGKLSQAINEETGSKLFVSSAYRTLEEQEKLYEEDSTTANIPGESEHQTGLGLDVYVQYYAGFGFIKSEAGQFVNSNCWKYGFIIRYPSFGKSKSGMKYEPWHIRYVGEPHAKIIYNNHLTLEEYIESLEYDKWYQVDNYFISRQKINEECKLFLPEYFDSAIISLDNTGSYIITVRE